MAGKKIVKQLPVVDLKAIKDFIVNEKKLTMSEISTQMGYDRSYLSAVLNGTVNLTTPLYKMLCMMLGVDESKFMIKANIPSENVTPAQNPALTAEQFNVIIQSISTLNDTVSSLVKAVNAMTVIHGQIYKEVQSFTEAFGVTPTTKKETTPPPQAHVIKK